MKLSASTFASEVDSIVAMHDALMNIVSAESGRATDSGLNEYVRQGKVLLSVVKNIQKRYNEAAEIGFELSSSMQWLYVTAMKAMQDVYDNGIGCWHYKFVREWPELTEWLRSRVKK